MERINQLISIQEAVGEIKLPAVEMKLMRELGRKIDLDVAENRLDLKVDKETMEAVNERLIKVEEIAEKLKANMADEDEMEEEEEDGSEEIEIGGDGTELKSPGTGAKKGGKSPGLKGRVNNEALNEMTKKIEAIELKLAEKLTELREVVDTNVEELKTESSETKKSVQEFEEKLKEI